MSSSSYRWICIIHGLLCYLCYNGRIKRTGVTNVLDCDCRFLIVYHVYKLCYVELLPHVEVNVFCKHDFVASNCCFESFWYPFNKCSENVM